MLHIARLHCWAIMFMRFKTICQSLDNSYGSLPTRTPIRKKDRSRRSWSKASRRNWNWMRIKWRIGWNICGRIRWRNSLPRRFSRRVDWPPSRQRLEVNREWTTTQKDLASKWLKKVGVVNESNFQSVIVSTAWLSFSTYPLFISSLSPTIFFLTLPLHQHYHSPAWTGTNAPRENSRGSEPHFLHAFRRYSVRIRFISVHVDRRHFKCSSH